MLAGEMREYEPGKSTGPTSANGKDKSSRNAVKHGLRSAKFLILSSESAADFEAMLGQWVDRYLPRDDFEYELVERAVQKRWILRRADRRLLEADPEAANDGNEDSNTWDEAQHKRFHLMQRYQSHARRDYAQAKAELDKTLGDPNDRVLKQEITRGRRLDNDIKQLDLERRKKEIAEQARPISGAGPGLESKPAERLWLQSGTRRVLSISEAAEKSQTQAGQAEHTGFRRTNGSSARR
jgi:hypothetical protein